MDIKEKLKLLPSAPGIYVMKDSSGNIIYIGKSKNLKNRVNQYFIKNSSRTPKVEKLVKNIRDFDFFITDTELEALLLECKLIKELKPPYNRQMKNYEGYPYIRITVSETFPKIDIVNYIEEENDIYFGPFNSLGKVEKSVEFIKQMYPIRKCSIFPRGKNACLEFHLGSCIAPCINSDVASMYNYFIEEINDFFLHDKSQLILRVENMMKAASANLNFEKAVFYRDGLEALNYLRSAGKTIKASSKRSNIISIEKMNNEEFKYLIICGRDIIFSQIVKKDYLQKSIEENLSNLCLGNEKETNSKQEIDFYSIIHSYLRRNKSKIYSTKIPKKINNKFYEKLKNEVEKI